MARDGAGNMAIPYTSFTAGQKIKSAEVNADFSTIVSEITNSMPRDGQAAPTHDIPFGSYKITGMGAGSSATDSANLGQIQAQAFIWCGTAGGTKNALTLTPSPAITAYAAGQTFRFIAASTSDDVVTIAISGLATKNIKYKDSALGAFYCLVSGRTYEIVYDGTAFQIIGAIDDHSSALDPVVTAATLAAARTALGVVGKVVSQVFISSGTYTPTSGMLYAEVIAVGGGGGGGGCSTTTSTEASAAGGGGGGAFTRKIFTAAQIGASQTVTIGSGGTGGVGSGANGTSGGNTTFGSLLTANGGSYGTGGTSSNSSTGSPGGAGGTGSGGDFNVTGQTGSWGLVAVGGGGYMAISGAGGNTLYGHGGASIAGSDGDNGKGYGGGGGGAANYASRPARTGGVGASGLVYIIEYCN